MTENNDEPEHQLAVIVNRISSNQESDRLQSMCSLLNAFNFAVQIQGGRNNWEPSDFRSFAIALCAMDLINETQREKGVLQAVERAMQPAHTRNAK